MTNDRTEEQWLVHAINIQGMFFEAWVAYTFKRREYWSVRATGLPVAWGTPSHESELDVLAERGTEFRLTFITECKKHNPDYADWVFFERLKSSDMAVYEHRRHEASTPSGWGSGKEQAHLQLALPLVNVGREVRANYGTYSARDKTKTANNAINDASYQVAVAHQYIVRQDELSIGIYDNKAGATRPDRRIFVPLVVTTARLATLAFGPDQVAAETGEIPAAAVQVKPADAVLYSYGLPPHLHASGNAIVRSDGSYTDVGTRMEILVVNSAALKQVLDQIDQAVTTHTLLRKP